MSDASIVRQVVRVEIELADGTVKRLVGEAAARWEAECNKAVVSAYIHGVKLPDFPWEVLT